MPASESDRILAAGVEVALADRTVTLRYSLRSLKALEDHFGSVRDALDALNGLYDRTNTKTIGTVVPALAAGLLHEGVTTDALFDGLARHDEMGSYLASVSQAMDEAFPPARPGRGKADPSGDSSGDASTTPPTTSATTANGSGG